MSRSEKREVEVGKTYLIAVENRTILKCKSSKATVAYVEDNGLLRPLKAGKATITVTTASGYGKLKLKLTVVDPVAPTAIGFEEGQGITVCVGDRLALMPSLIPSTARTTLTWSSGSTRVASVSDDGVVTAHMAGKAKITVKTGNGKKASILVTVLDPNAPVGVIIADGSERSLGVDQSLQLSAEVLPDTAPQDITWKSSKPGVATVSDSGVVKGIKPGKAKITATATGTHKKATVTVRVIDGVTVTNGLEIECEPEGPAVEAE